MGQRVVASRRNAVVLRAFSALVGGLAAFPAHAVYCEYLWFSTRFHCEGSPSISTPDSGWSQLGMVLTYFNNNPTLPIVYAACKPNWLLDHTLTWNYRNLTTNEFGVDFADLTAECNYDEA